MGHQNEPEAPCDPAGRAEPPRRKQRVTSAHQRALEPGAGFAGSFFEVALDCVLIADESGRVVEFNPSAEEVFGYSRESALGRTIAELIVPPSLRDRHRQAYARFVATGQKHLFGQRVEVTAMRSDGSEFPVELALSQVEGEQVLVCAAVRDLTVAKQAETDLRRLADEQRALRRAATLVARGGDIQELFEMVCSEAGRLVDAPRVELVQYRSGEAPITLCRWPTEGTESGHPSDEIDVRSTVLIKVGATDWGAIVVHADHSLPAAALESVERLGELTAIAISNATARSELLASRTRIIAAADEARRRLQRDIHDGAQQRLVTSLIHLQLAADRIDSDPDAARHGLLAALENSKQGLAELRDLAAGLHPSILTRGGLGAALDGLAARSSLPVSVEAGDDRYPREAEVAIYFLVAEALTNVDKHAHASQAHVVVTEKGADLVVVVSDDGIGGVRLDSGSGLRGLHDRAIALGGTLSIDSGPHQGTTIRATFPGRAATSS